MNGFNSSADRAQYSVNGGNMLDSLEDFYIQGIYVGLLQILVPSIIPTVEYFEMYHRDDRLYPYTFAFIAGNGIIGLLGLVANSVRKSAVFALHIATSIGLGCVLGGMALLLSHLVVLQCNLKSDVFDGCNAQNCTCLSDDSCNSDDFNDRMGCGSCTAYPQDICSYFDYDRTRKGFNYETYKGILMVFMAVISASHSLLLLIRREYVQYTQNSRKEWISGQIVEQISKIKHGEQPTMESFQLKRLVQMCERYDPSLASETKQAINTWENGDTISPKYYGSLLGDDVEGDDDTSINLSDEELTEEDIPNEIREN